MSSHEELLSFESDRVVALEVFLRTCLLSFTASSPPSSSPFKGDRGDWGGGWSGVVGLSNVERLVGLVREEEDSSSSLVGAERFLPFGKYGLGGGEFKYETHYIVHQFQIPV